MSHVAAFVGVAAVVICTPGPDTALIVRNTLLGGRAAGLRTTGGIVCGIAVWTVAASVGIAAVVAASRPLFDTIRFAGAAYLVWLGLQTLRGHHRAEVGSRHGSTYRQGLFSNLGNPKIAIFFTTFLPQFARGNHPPFSALLLLALAFCAIGLSWLSLYNVAISRLGGVLRRPRIRRALEGITGAVLVGFGARLALERR